MCEGRCTRQAKLSVNSEFARAGFTPSSTAQASTDSRIIWLARLLSQPQARLMHCLALSTVYIQRQEVAPPPVGKMLLSPNGRRSGSFLVCTQQGTCTSSYPPAKPAPGAEGTIAIEHLMASWAADGKVAFVERVAQDIASAVITLVFNLLMLQSSRWVEVFPPGLSTLDA